jgi:hypothetical protein
MRSVLRLTVDEADAIENMTSMCNILAWGSGEAWRRRKRRWLGTVNEVCTRRATTIPSLYVTVCTGERYHQKGITIQQRRDLLLTTMADALTFLGDQNVGPSRAP